jgi:sugar phosphate isomerase/epimerase
MKLLIAYGCLPSLVGQRETAIDKIPEVLRAAQLDGYEIADRHLMTLPPADRKRMAAAAAAKGLEIVLDINVDLTHREAARRRLQIAHAIAQIRAAHPMGVRRARISLGGQVLSMQKVYARQPRPQTSQAGPSTTAGGRSPRMAVLKTGARWLAHNIRKNSPARVLRRHAKTEAAIAALRRIAAVAGGLGIRIGIENHWGLSSRPEWIMAVVDRVASPFLGTCPDFGNWPRGVAADEGVAALAPKAVLAHIKSIDPRKNTTRRFKEIKRKVDLLLNHDYAGPFTLEYEGLADPRQSIHMTAGLLRRHYP